MLPRSPQTRLEAPVQLDGGRAPPPRTEPLQHMGGEMDECWVRSSQKGEEKPLSCIRTEKMMMSFRMKVTAASRLPRSLGNRDAGHIKSPHLRGSGWAQMKLRPVGVA